MKFEFDFYSKIQLNNFVNKLNNNFTKINTQIIERINTYSLIINFENTNINCILNFINENYDSDLNIDDLIDLHKI